MRRALATLSLLSVTTAFSSLPAQATMTPSLPRGERLVEIVVPGRQPEICVIPAQLPEADYSKKDFEQQEALCQLDRHVNAAVCPKLESTNPGLSFFLLAPGDTPASLQAKNCEDAKKVAKYKLSTSCSYTPSILAYYHVSRLLGGVVNVPVSVMRTFDLETHLQMAKSAVRMTAPKGGQDEPLIYQTWSGLKSALEAGPASKRKDLLFTDDFTQSYGALVKNPTGESFYKEFFTSAKGAETRAQAFGARNPIYQRLISTAPAAQLVGQSFTAQNVQALVQLKEAGEMILLDTILNQQDRFGNIAGAPTYYYRDNSETDSTGNPKIKSKKKLTPEEVKALGAVEVKEMVLKDNDCGVSKENRAKAARLLDRVAHMDPKTYTQLLKFDAMADDPGFKKLFRQGMIFTETDYAGMRKNLREAASTLQQSCRDGRLKLDLDLEAHFGGNSPQNVSCEL